MALTPLELTKHAFFDTKELPSGDCVKLEFFDKPNPDQQLSNWPAKGVLPHPQQFYLFGLLLNIRLANFLTSFPKNSETLRKILVDNCNISYVVGHTCHLNVPVLSVTKGYIPGTHKHLFQAPGTKKDCVNMTPGHIANPEPGDFFYDTCIWRDGRQVPAHIVCVQFVQVALTWLEVPSYDIGMLGKVRFRVSMLGTLCKEASNAICQD